MPTRTARKRKEARRRAQAGNDNRGGHNKRDDVQRYDNGRIDYGATERMKTAIVARMRVHGVSKKEAMSDRAGTVFGRMAIQGEINEDQYEAGREFERRRAAYLKAILAPPPPRSGSDVGYMREPLREEDQLPQKVQRRRNDLDGTADEYVDFCRDAREKFAEVRRVALEADPFAVMALEAIVCDDKMVSGVVGALRVGCNAISHMMRPPKGT